MKVRATQTLFFGYRIQRFQTNNRLPIVFFFILHLILNSLKVEEFLNVADYLVHSSNLILAHISSS